MRHLKTYENNIELRPSDLAGRVPYDSELGKANYEFIADNIMIILYRTYNVFRPLSWEEYKKERLKDGEFTESEKKYFDAVIDWCTTPEKARRFSKNWDIKAQAETDSNKYNL